MQQERTFFELIRTAFDPENIDPNITFKPSTNSEFILNKRYYMDRVRKDPVTCDYFLSKENSYLELCLRVSKIISSFETLYSDDIEHIQNLNKHIFYDMFDGRFLFNSPALFSAGVGLTVEPAFADIIYKDINCMTLNDYTTLAKNRNIAQMLSACFVIDVEDSIEGIYDALKETAIISKFGGGVGLNFSRLREKGSKIAGGIGGESSGAISWLDDWNTMAKNVVQGGKRRAALMGMMSVDHPEIEEFIDAKVKEGELSYFNLSVAFNDTFMSALESNNDDFDLLSRTPKNFMKSVKKISAKTLWDKVCTSAWKKGDPGIFFIDSSNRDNILKFDPKFNIISTNPCLVGDTLVTVENGKTKQIKDIIVGDRVLCYDELNKTLTYNTVTFSGMTRKDAMCIQVDFGDTSIKLTPDHEVYTENRGYICAENLTDSDIIVSYTDLDIFEDSPNLVPTTTSVTRVSKMFEKHDVYDITVEENHNFFANGILVHNCAEEPGWDGFCCVLGSINLSRFVKTGEDKKTYFDMASFVQQVHRASYYLDLIPDASSFPTERITDSVKWTRPIGLGLMGLADVFIQADMVYGDEKSTELTEMIATVFSGTAMYSNSYRTRFKDAFPGYESVKKLFEKNGFVYTTDDDTEYGVNLIHKLIDLSKKNEKADKDTCIPYTWLNCIANLYYSSMMFYNKDTDDLTEYDKEYADFVFDLVNGNLRNSRMMSIAPTGTISMILDSSASIEPLFALTWDRLITLDKDTSETVTFYHHLLTDNDINRIRNGKELDEKWIVSNSMNSEDHIMPVRIFAKVIDSAISKTVNLPSDATVQDVKNIYEYCYKSGIKGITIYRDKSRDNQPISDTTSTVKTQTDKPSVEDIKHDPVKPEEETYVGPVKRRNNILAGLTEKANTPFGSMYLTANYSDQEILECFINLGKSGSEIRSMIEALSRVISIGLRSGTKIEDYITTLEGIAGSETWVYDTADGREVYVRSIPDMVAKMLANLYQFRIITGLDTTKTETVNVSEDELKCPECGSPNFRMESGCNVCPSCGYSKCK